MSQPTIGFRFEVWTTLDPLWYDERWHEELLADGYTEEGALREMLRMAWEEDWTSLVEEMTEGEGSRADVFVDCVKEVALVWDEDGRRVDISKHGPKRPASETAQPSDGRGPDRTDDLPRVKRD